MGSIEEDIERLNKLVTTKFNNDYSIDNIDKEALENLLSDYTRQKQINEEHQKINGELREKVKKIEEQLEIANSKIQELEEENAMLRKSNNIAENVNIDDVTQVINNSYEEFMSNYIPKQKVKQGLEDIEDYFDRLNGPDEDIEYIRHVKQEILEEEK